MHLLKTTEITTGKFYYSLFFGLKSKARESFDPFNKFELKVAEDGEKSVVTKLINTFGNKESALNHYASLHLEYEKHPKFISTMEGVTEEETTDTPPAPVENEPTPDPVEDDLVDNPTENTPIPVNTDEDVDNPTEVVIPEVDDSMKRGELDKIASDLGLDPSTFGNKGEVIDAINALRSE